MIGICICVVVVVICVCASFCRACLVLLQVDTKTLAKPPKCKGAGDGTATALDGSSLPDVVEYIKDGKVDLVINIPEVHMEIAQMDNTQGERASM